MLGLEKYIAQSGLDKTVWTDKTRASQINGLPYCINMHVGCNVNDINDLTNNRKNVTLNCGKNIHRYICIRWLF